MKKKPGLFVIGDSEKCTGCKACEIACFAVHNENNGVRKTVGTITTPVIPRLYLTKFDDHCMPIQCRQCEDAPCLNSCASHAIEKINGVMVVSYPHCIGCKNCLMACPFGAVELVYQYDKGQRVKQLSVDEDKIIANKCDLCYKSATQACVAACPNDALHLIDIFAMVNEKKLKAAITLAATGI